MLKKEQIKKRDETIEREMRELEETKKKEERMRKVLETQTRRLKRKEELEQMSKLSKSKVKKIRAVQGNRYAHEVLEQDYKRTVELPEIERQKQILEEQRMQHKSKYEAIQK